MREKVMMAGETNGSDADCWEWVQYKRELKGAFHYLFRLNLFFQRNSGLAWHDSSFGLTSARSH